MRRMIRLAKNFKRICDLRRDVTALVALSARAIAFWIITTILLVTVVGISVTSMQLSDDLKQTLSLTNKAILSSSLIIAMLGYFSGFLIFAYEIFPLIDFKKYQKRTRERLTRLIDKSDWSPMEPEMRRRSRRQWTRPPRATRRSCGQARTSGACQFGPECP